MTISILTPYNRSDTTMAAIRLADLAVALGYDVNFISCDFHENNIHSFWDSKVIKGKSHNIYTKTKDSKKVIYFLINNDLLNKVQLVTKQAIHVLVPSWHKLLLNTEIYKEYNKVVIPDRSFFTYFVNNIKAKNTHYCLWEAGLPSLPREGTVESNKVITYFFCDNNVIDFCGTLVLELVNELLKNLIKLEVILIYNKSWPKKDRKLIKELSKNNRFKHEKISNIHRQILLLHKCDWFVYPAVRGDFAMPVFYSLSCGVPVIVNDVNPFNNIITNNTTGFLVPCENKTLNSKAPMAIQTFGQWYSVCYKAFSSTRQLFSMQQHDWQLQKLTRTFNSFWSKLLAE